MKEKSMPFLPSSETEVYYNHYIDEREIDNKLVRRELWAALRNLPGENSSVTALIAADYVYPYRSDPDGRMIIVAIDKSTPSKGTQRKGLFLFPWLAKAPSSTLQPDSRTIKIFEMRPVEGEKHHTVHLLSIKEAAIESFTDRPHIGGKTLPVYAAHQDNRCTLKIFFGNQLVEISY